MNTINEDLYEEHMKEKEDRSKRRKKNVLNKSTVSPNLIAKDLRTPKYRMKVVEDGRERRVTKHELLQQVLEETLNNE